MAAPFDFPPSFILRNLCQITGSAFELKENPNRELANITIREWFKRFQVYDDHKTEKYLASGRFDLFAALSFPDADLTHLETCLAFLLWAFTTDDLSDEGDLQRKPKEVQSGHDVSRKLLHDFSTPRPKYPYAAMLWEQVFADHSTVRNANTMTSSLLRRIQVTGTFGMYNRFAQAFFDWSMSQVQQSSNRNVDRLPPVKEFILMRRCTIGAALVEAMVEYSLDIDLPSYVFQDPIVIAMSQAISDIMTWPNDLCSFNKEQADGDYQNLVCVLQHNHNLDLQGAVDMLTEMIETRVKEYVDLKERLPSFGPKIDPVLRTYHTALEHFTQGCLVWYYSSPRYFPNVDPLEKDQVVIELFKRN